MLILQFLAANSKEDTLYIADFGGNAVRRMNLVSKAVDTLVTGQTIPNKKFTCCFFRKFGENYHESFILLFDRISMV